MIIAELIGKKLVGINGSQTTLKLIFEGEITLELYPYIKRAGAKPEVAWAIHTSNKQ